MYAGHLPCCPSILQVKPQHNDHQEVVPAFIKFASHQDSITREQICHHTDWHAATWANNEKTHFSGLLLKESNFFLGKRRGPFGKCSSIDFELPHSLIWITFEINTGFLVQSADGNRSTNDRPWVLGHGPAHSVSLWVWQRRLVACWGHQVSDCQLGRLPRFTFPLLKTTKCEK